jgi:methionyl-tRNA synthetase
VKIAVVSDTKALGALQANTLNAAIQAIRFLGTVLQPFMPRKAKLLCDAFQLSESERQWPNASQTLAAGRAFTIPPILFAKLEAPAE